VRLSTRLPDRADTNALTRLAVDIARQGGTILDLTDSNPTSAGVRYEPDLLQPLADAGGLVYRPQPLGLDEARAAIAADCGRRGVSVSPSDVVLTASTSEAYSWLFKLLCDPGDAVLVPRPSYPLFEHLTRLEGVRIEQYDLVYHGRWEIDFASCEAASDRVRAVLVVSPNNPTGSYISAREFAALSEFCRTRGCALLADEVFADYPLETADPLTDLAVKADVLTFTLAGLSKTLGLPQLKLGWIVIGGPASERGRVVAGLELIADSFLSVSTPVQRSAPVLLKRAAAVRSALHDRVRTNLIALRRAAEQYPACRVLRAEGGWSAVVRIPATRTEERFVLDLLRDERILVHPGYFFDFSSEAFVVVSLLVPEPRFSDAVSRLLRAATAA
jgi:aspartate/methionine/tyrosine aminotransferase